MPSVLLVRHGQASFGADDYDVLSERGHRQAEVLAGRLGALPGGVARVWSGTMRRQRDTAAPVLVATERELEVDARFDEYDHEALLAAAVAADPQGVLGEATDLATHLDRAADPARAFQAALERALARWIGGADDLDEPYEAFRARVRAGLEAVVDELAGGQTGVVVTSGGVIAAVVADALALDPAGWGRINTVGVNAAITRLVVGRRGTTLVAFNDHAHLEGHDQLVTYR